MKEKRSKIQFRRLWVWDEDPKRRALNKVAGDIIEIVKKFGKESNYELEDFSEFSDIDTDDNDNS